MVEIYIKARLRRAHTVSFGIYIFYIKLVVQYYVCFCVGPPRPTAKFKVDSWQGFI